MRTPNDDAAIAADNKNEPTDTIPEVTNDGWICPTPEQLGMYYEEKPDGNGIFWLPTEIGYSPANEKNLRRSLIARELILPGRKGYAQFEAIVMTLQELRRVQGAGSIAGRSPGVINANGRQFLVTSGPRLVRADAGVDWRDLRQIIEGTLGLVDEGRQLPYFYGWLKIAHEALKMQVQQVGQALAIAGPAGCGKTLLQAIITEALGGREANPWPWMQGKTNFNHDFMGAEHLCFGDEIGDTTLGARRNLAAKIKGLVANPTQRLEAKGKDAAMVKPFWRITMTLNDEPEYLSVIPPLDPSVMDKIMLFRASPCPYFETEKWQRMSPTDRHALIVSQLPGLMHFLEADVQIEAKLKQVRTGIRSYHNGELMNLLGKITNESRLLEFVDELVFAPKTPESDAGCWEGRSADLQKRLYQLVPSMSPAERQLGSLLSWGNAIGNYLSKLSSTVAPDRVERRTVNGSHRYRITAPAPDAELAPVIGFRTVIKAA